MKRCSALSALGFSCLLAACTFVAGAQTDAPAHIYSSARPRQTGHRPMVHFPHAGHMGKMPAGSGRIIGNKHSHVYHLPGDKGSMPDAQNRVYFRTEAEAKAAGYRLAGKSPIGGTMGGHSMSHTMSHNRMSGKKP